MVCPHTVGKGCGRSRLATPAHRSPGTTPDREVRKVADLRFRGCSTRRDLSRTDFVEREPRSVIVLDGLFSTRPEPSGLIDLSVPVDAPVETGHKRLSAREEPSFLARRYPLWSPIERW